LKKVRKIKGRGGKFGFKSREFQERKGDTSDNVSPFLGLKKTLKESYSQIKY